MSTALRPRRGATSPLALIAGGLAITLAAVLLHLHLQRGRARSAQAQPAIAQDAARTRDRSAVADDLLAYRPAGLIPTGLQTPRGIALPPGNQGLAVAGDRVLRTITWSGAVLGETPLDDDATCVAAATDGTLYVGVRTHVEIYDATGRRLATWAPVSNRSYITCIAVNGDDVYVGDAGQRIVVHYDRTGKALTMIGARDPARGIPGLVMPSPHLDVAVDPTGLLWVTNPGRRSVERYDRQGNRQRAWGESSPDLAGFSGCCNPTDLALLADDGVVTAEKGIPRIKVYEPSGKLRAVVAPPEALSPGAAGVDLAVDAAGRILALDRPLRAIRVFEPIRKKSE